MNIYDEIELAPELPNNYELYFDLVISDELIFGDPFTSHSDTIVAIDPFEFSMIVIDDDEFPDSWGNNDGIINPGEDVELVPMINNTMEYDFSGVSGKLICNNPNVTVWDCPPCNPPYCPKECGIDFNVSDQLGYGYINEDYQFQTGIPGFKINAMPIQDYVFTFNGIQETSIEFSIVITGNASGITLVPGLDKWIVSFTINNGYPPYCPEVWPGDVNNDKLVDGRDLLPLGVHFGETGLPRDSISNLWMGHNSDDWDRLQYNYMNLKFADCNGDGTIDYLDTLAISSNYSETHLKDATYNENHNSGGPEIYLRTFDNKFEKGKRSVIELYAGTEQMPVENLYGLLMHASYDRTVIELGSVQLSFPHSWFYSNPKKVLSLSNNDTDYGRIETGIVRNDHIASSGHGKIGEISFVAKEDIGSIQEYPIIKIGVLDAINENGERIELHVNNDLKLKYAVDNSDVIVYPNPSEGNINIILPKLQSNTILTIYGINGKHVFEMDFGPNTEARLFKANLNGVSEGVYMLNLVNNEFSIHKKIYIR